jgi:hypothetical protein
MRLMKQEQRDELSGVKYARLIAVHHRKNPEIGVSLPPSCR